MKEIQVKNNLKEILASKNISGLRLANDLGVADSWIYSHIMRENYCPHLKTALAIADYLSIPVGDIWQLDKK